MVAPIIPGSTVNPPKRPPDHSRTTSAVRDLIGISLVALLAYVLGVLTGVWQAIYEAAAHRFQGDLGRPIALVTILALALAWIAVRRWRQLGRETRLRQETELRFRKLVEEVPAISYTWDATRPTGEAPPIYVSPQIEQILGFAPDEWVSDPRLWIESVHPGDRGRVVAASNASDRSGAPFCEEYRMIARDGRVVWIRDESVTVARDAGGRPLRAQGMMLDITARKEAELRLQEAENRYRTIVERVPAVAYVRDSGFEPGTAPVAYISPQVERLLGFTADEWLEDSSLWSQQAHSEDSARALALWEDAVRRDAPFAAEYRIYARDGRLLWVRDEAVPVAEGTRGHPLYQGVMVDITEQKRAEERFRTLVEHLPVVTYVNAPPQDGAGRERYIAPGIEPLTGYTVEEWLADPELWATILHPHDRDAVLAESQRCEEPGDPFDMEYRLVRKDGSVVWIRDEALILERRGPGRARATWQGVFQDVTARREAEEKLREAEGRYRSLVEQMPAAVYIDAVDDVSTAVYVSPQYERLLGYTAEERVADPGLWVRALHPDDRDRVLAESLRTNETGDPFQIDYRLIHKDGRVVWVRDHAVLVGGDPGGARYWQGVLTDITENKRAEEALARSDRILEAAGFAAERFLHAPAWGDVIQLVLDRLGVVVEASRAYVFENRWAEAGDLLWVQRYEWTATPELATIHDAAFVCVDVRGQGFRRWERVLGAGDAIHGPVASLPKSERPDLERQSILSLCVVPVFVAGEWWGFIGFDQCDAEREWGQAEIDSLKVVATTLGAAIGRELADRRLSETEARYRTLVEQIPAITYVEDPRTGKNVYISPQLESVLGYTRGEWGPSSFWNALHPDDREFVRAEDTRANESGEPYKLEYRMRAKDGRWVWLRDEALLIRDERGLPLVWQGVRFDVTAQKEAEEQLRQAEERFRTLVEQLPVITYVDEYSEDEPDVWPTVYISPQVEALLGYSPQEWKNDPRLWRSLIHPEDRQRAEEADRLHYESGRPLVSEVRLFARDGGIRWIRDEAVLIYDDEGRPRFSQGILIDVTARTEAEQQLHEAEERYRTLVERLPAIIYLAVTGEAAPWLYVSPQVETILGYTAEEWRANPRLWMDLIHPDDLDRVMAEEFQSRDSGRSLVSEYRMRARDGRIVWVRDEAEVVPGIEGGPPMLRGLMLDITDRRGAEEQLREAEQRYRAIVEHVPAAIYVEVPDGSMQTVYVSPQIEQIMGITSDQYISDPEIRLSLMRPDDRGEIRRSYLASIEQGMSWRAEYRVIRPDGREVWVHDETTIVRDEQDRPLFLQGVMFDVTEQKLAEQALRDSEQREREAAERLRALDEMKNTFLAAVSHELRSPLTSILGLSLTLERQESLPDEDRADLLERLAANARKLDRLLRDLLDIDRLNRGIVAPQSRLTDVGALARRTVESIDALADRSVVVQAESVVIEVDPAKVERIVENLLVNAARHTGPENSVWLRVETADGGVLIAVEDDGPGVPAELRQAIFEPFRQGPTASKSSPGTGIGLSLVGRFAELHGGRAWVQERSGGGASFRVFLPSGPGPNGPGWAAPADDVSKAR